MLTIKCLVSCTASQCSFLLPERKGIVALHRPLCWSGSDTQAHFYAKSIVLKGQCLDSPASLLTQTQGKRECFQPADRTSLCYMSGETIKTQDKITRDCISSLTTAISKTHNDISKEPLLQTTWKYIFASCVSCQK